MSTGGGAPVNAADFKLNMPNNTGSVYIVRACGAVNIGDGLTQSEASTPPDCPLGSFDVEVARNEGEVHALNHVGVININDASCHSTRTAACMNNNVPFVPFVVGAPPHEHA